MLKVQNRSQPELSILRSIFYAWFNCLIVLTLHYNAQYNYLYDPRDPNDLEKGVKT